MQFILELRSIKTLKIESLLLNRLVVFVSNNECWNMK